MNEPLPPNDPVAEAALLCCLIADELAPVTDVLKVLKPEDFYLPRHRAVFTAIKHIHARGDLPDFVMVDAELDFADAHVSIAELVAITDPEHVHVLHIWTYAIRVGQMSRARQAISLAGRLAAAAYGTPALVDEAMERACFGLSVILDSAFVGIDDPRIEVDHTVQVHRLG